MKIAIASDIKGFDLKEHLKNYLTELDFDMVDLTPEKNQEFYDATVTIAKYIQEGKADKGIMIDEYGVGPSIVANKFKDIICANTFDEHSAKMTNAHNGANLMTMGSGIVGVTLAEKIAETFAKSTYDGGRHQVRVDMLNKML